MSYAVYFKYKNRKYKLPVNPEEIKVRQSIGVETYEVLGAGQISIPTHTELREISFEAEFPSKRYSYVTSGRTFKKASHYEKMLRNAQINLEPIRFIASNQSTDDISIRALVKSIEVVEKAGEEGDKYISVVLTEYKPPGKKYIAVSSASGENVKKEEKNTQDKNPAVGEQKKHTVVKGDTLWGLAKKYYGNGELFKKIADANPSIKNPNRIQVGDVLNIPQ